MSYYYDYIWEKKRENDSGENDAVEDDQNIFIDDNKGENFKMSNIYTENSGVFWNVLNIYVNELNNGMKAVFE